jgi:hypothetical protein
VGSGVQHDGPIVLLAFGPRLFPHTAFQEHVFARFRPQGRPSTWHRRRQPLRLGLLAVNDAWRAQPYARAPSTRRGQPELTGRFPSRGFRFPPLPLPLTTSVHALIYVYVGMLLRVWGCGTAGERGDGRGESVDADYVRLGQTSDVRVGSLCVWRVCVRVGDAGTAGVGVVKWTQTRGEDGRPGCTRNITNNALPNTPFPPGLA